MVRCLRLVLLHHPAALEVASGRMAPKTNDDENDELIELRGSTFHYLFTAIVPVVIFFENG